jgi:hypothetical protein
MNYLIIGCIMIFFVKENPRRAYKFSILLGIILIINLVLYTIIVELIKFYIEPFNGFYPETDVVMLRYLLIGVSIVELFLIPFLRRFMIKQQFKHDRGIKDINRTLVLASLLTYALCEGIALYGLILFLYAGISLDFYLFLILCLIFLGIFFPRYSEWVVWIKQVEERVAEI